MAEAVTAAAHPNLALVKYWGNVDDALNLPANGSLSVNLSSATTTTTVAWEPALTGDEITLNGAPADAATRARVTRHLDRVRTLAGFTTPARVTSVNDFPAAAGIASSASAFAALTLAATRAAGLQLEARALSALARLGSGSACRSIPDGFAEWLPGTDDRTSYAISLAPPSHWDLRITTLIIDDRPKAISSSRGHRVAPTSPFYQARLAALPHTLATVRAALLARDLPTLGLTVEREAIALHTIAMTSVLGEQPWASGIYYWQPATLAAIQAVQTWRQGGLPVYLTIDAGPNVHLLCEGDTQPALEQVLTPLLAQWGGRAIVSRPARGAWIVA